MGTGTNGRGLGMGDTQDAVEGESLSDFLFYKSRKMRCKRSVRPARRSLTVVLCCAGWEGLKDESRLDALGKLPRRVYGEAPRISSILNGDWHVGQRPQLGNDAD